MLARCAFFIRFFMKLDPKITQALRDWLDTPSDRQDIKTGADLMLSLNRNRALYNSIIRHPEKYKAKLVYELKKYLNMRLANMTVADVSRMEADVIPKVEKIIDQVPVVSPDDELPEGMIALGRRSDHDDLPLEIRQLWDSNADRYKRIVLLFNELKAMSHMQPCDRFEKLHALDIAERKYRDNLARYDAYVADAAHTGDDASPCPDDTGADTGESGAEIDKAVNNARKTLSKYRKLLTGLSAEDPRRAVALDKIQSAVSVILACGAGVSKDSQAELAVLGIRFE